MAISFVCAILGACSFFPESDVTRYSAEIKTSGRATVLLTRAVLTGAAHGGKLVVGETKELATSGRYSIRISYLSDREDQPDKSCEDSFEAIDFDTLSSRLDSFARPPRNLKEIVFEAIYVSPDLRYEYKDRRLIDEKLLLRFPFAAPPHISDCRIWWKHALATIVHEYAHVYTALTEFEVPNAVSGEVIAYSVERCALLAIAQPNELRLTTFEQNGERLPIEVLYPRFVNIEFAWADPHKHAAERPSGPSLRGKVLADLQLFELFGRSTPNALTKEQQIRVEDYCQTVAHVPINFLEQSYFGYMDTIHDRLRRAPKNPEAD